MLPWLTITKTGDCTPGRPDQMGKGEGQAEVKLTPLQLEQRRTTRARNKEAKRLTERAHALIDSGFAQQARRCHPDVGGTTQAMMELGTIRDFLHAQLGVPDLRLVPKFYGHSEEYRRQYERIMAEGCWRRVAPRVTV